MKFEKIALLILYCISLGIVLIMNQMTPNPGTSSGNGNPALLIAVILFPILITIVLLWIRVLRRSSISIKISIISIIGILIHLTVAFFYRQKELNDYREVIKEALIKSQGIADEEYVQAITSGLSIHINNQNFNINTYFMFVTFTLLIALLYNLWDLLEKKNEK